LLFLKLSLISALFPIRFYLGISAVAGASQDNLHR